MSSTFASTINHWSFPGNFPRAKEAYSQASTAARHKLPQQQRNPQSDQCTGTRFTGYTVGEKKTKKTRTVTQATMTQVMHGWRLIIYIFIWCRELLILSWLSNIIQCARLFAQISPHFQGTIGVMQVIGRKVLSSIFCTPLYPTFSPLSFLPSTRPTKAQASSHFSFRNPDSNFVQKW